MGFFNLLRLKGHLMGFRSKNVVAIILTDRLRAACSHKASIKDYAPNQVLAGYSRYGWQQAFWLWSHIAGVMLSCGFPNRPRAKADRCAGHRSAALSAKEFMSEAEACAKGYGPAGNGT